MAAGVFGYMGYDTVRLVEHLPDERPDALGVPDSIFVRPTIMVVFDAVKDEMIVVTPVYPQPGIDAQTAYAAAVERLRGVVAALDEPLPHATSHVRRRSWRCRSPSPTPRPTSTWPWWSAPRSTSPPATSSRSCWRSASAAPFTLPPFALYRALRRTNPSPFLFHLDFGGFALVGSIARDPGARARRRGDDPAARRHAPARRHAGGGQGAGGGAARRPQGARRAPDAARPRPQRRRPRRRDRHGARHRELRRRALQPRHAHRHQRRGQARPAARRRSTR